MGKNYKSLYENLARNSDETGVGGGDYDLVGKIELGLLKMEGLLPEHSLLDFGCGNGRLAIKAIPYLYNGNYVGVDISDTFIESARKRIRKSGNYSCNYNFINNNSYGLPFEQNSFDYMCAFSVFTHMEHEDSYKYLLEAKRIVKPNGKFIFSCLPITLKMSKDVFIGETNFDLTSRWDKVRNIVTSVELMTEISKMAGWEVLDWYPGDVPNIKYSDSPNMLGLGQSSCILRRPI